MRNQAGAAHVRCRVILKHDVRMWVQPEVVGNVAIYISDEKKCGETELQQALPPSTDAATLFALLVEGQGFEAVGQLVGGIAHEINSTIQFIGDNLNFFSDVSKEMILNLKSGETPESDLSYMMKEVPEAIAQSIEGVQRIASIIKAMKEFSRHGNDCDFVAVDINKIVRNALAISRNEWKYVAEAELELDNSFPAIESIPSELNHAILTLVTIAARTVKEAVARNPTGEPKLGRIRVTTKADGNGVSISIINATESNPETRQPPRKPSMLDVADRTSLRLHIANKTIVERHHGSMNIESGSCFHVWLPCRQDASTETTNKN